MNRLNRFLPVLLVVVGVSLVVGLSLVGQHYYRLPETERTLHHQHLLLKPDGVGGHTYGVAGVLLIGMNLLYLARRHVGFMRRVGSLKTWMQIHVFAGLVGPTLVLFHSAFLYANPIAVIAVISLAALVFTGIIGRYIYAQVPHTVRGIEESVGGLRMDAQQAVTELVERAGEEYVILMEKLDGLVPALPSSTHNPIQVLLILAGQPWHNWQLFRRVKRIYREFLKETGLTHIEAKPILRDLRFIVRLRVRMRFFFAFRGLLAWWRGLHRYFALLMLITAIIHIVISIYMGARWLL